MLLVLPSCLFLPPLRPGDTAKKSCSSALGHLHELSMGAAGSKRSSGAGLKVVVAVDESPVSRESLCLVRWAAVAKGAPPRGRGVGVGLREVGLLQGWAWPAGCHPYSCGFYAALWILLAGKPFKPQLPRHGAFGA